MFEELVVLELALTLPFLRALTMKGFAAETPLDNEVLPRLEETSLDVDFYSVFLIRMQPNHIRNFFL
jgi:hypothetical protein